MDILLTLGILEHSPLMHRTSHKTSLNGGNTVPRHARPTCPDMLGVQDVRPTARSFAYYISQSGRRGHALSLYTAPGLWTSIPLLDSGPVYVLWPVNSDLIQPKYYHSSLQLQACMH